MIGFIGAMDLEIEALTKRMQNVEHSTISGIDFYQGLLANKECVVTKSGVGKILAALSTTVLFENFDIDGVVNIGTAGGLQDNQEVLDVVISQRVAQHDIDVSVFNWPKGFDQDKTCYGADQHYIDIMKTIMENHHDRIWIGNIASGDQFVSTEAQVNKILEEYPGALCAEMESGAVACVCNHYQKPWIIIRSLSDITLHPHNEMTFDEYAVKASERSALWCEKFMEMI